ncbi:DNA primase [Aureibaculum sp. 2210JD6-5]|uniref:DNA primase n=1 Tax=Aureibaculum sp. 2210JD6-5 TaxID=3103957 RepID=UPI002AAD72F1|nr:DNA primase [Aureibaculum sp. 2210JD6-5]MDY7396267.1 DNA primase [Aureibaculum sp. 2210JD6-5]
MITRNTIDKVFETARVEEVIGDFVQLKKAGSNFKGLSPFVNEKSPSFMVSPVKQIWKDFSSGKGGNAISFLMEHEHYSYPEAIRYLAKKYNIEIEETEQSDEQKVQASERESMYLVSEFARNYFHDVLLNTQKGKAIGLSYFKERGFTDKTIEKFELGYALDEWSAFTDTALKKGYQLEFLEKTGLTIVKENQSVPNQSKYFDRFKGRVLFPIHSMSGRVLGFGGRILTSDKKAAKYLNSPESEIYHKSKVLYGIFNAKKSIAKEDNCYLVEGYTDVISFYQRGIQNVVASSGTALTSDQIRLVSRLTPNITVLFDGDAAGIRASIRGVDLILEQGMNVKVVAFPDGEDPDTFAKKNSLEKLQEYLDTNAQDFIRFKVSLLMDEVKDDPVKKAGLIRDIVATISKIPNQIQREIYVQECAKIMDISERVLFSELAQISKKEEREAAKRPIEEQQEAFTVEKSEKIAFKKTDQLNKLERKLIEILLLYGNKEIDFEDYVEVEDEEGKTKLVKENYQNTIANEIYLHLQDDEIEFSNEIFQKIYFDVIHQLNQNEKINSDGFINHEDPELGKMVTDILMDDEKYILSDWERKEIYVRTKEKSLSKLVMDAILNLRRILIELKIKELMDEETPEEERQSMLEMVVNYTELKKLLYEKLNRVV